MMHPDAIHWTPEMLAALRTARAQGLPWDDVGDVVGVSGKAARRKAIALGIPTRALNRGPMPGRIAVTLEAAHA